MTDPHPTCPAPRSRVIELYFMEHRAKLIDIAAFLDRLDRAENDGGGGDDFRVAAFRRAVAILLEAEPGRGRRVLELFSDPTSDPIPAAGVKGATGAWPGTAQPNVPRARRGKGARA